MDGGQCYNSTEYYRVGLEMVWLSDAHNVCGSGWADMVSDWLLERAVATWRSERRWINISRTTSIIPGGHWQPPVSSLINLQLRDDSLGFGNMLVSYKNRREFRAEYHSNHEGRSVKVSGR